MKTWQIGNGAHKHNLHREVTLREIGPADFDEAYEDRMAHGDKLPYRQLPDGTWRFARKRDFAAAVACLRKAGFLL